MHLAKKAASIFSAVAVALSLTLPISDISLAKTASAADTKVTYDFRDGSIIPTDTNGKSDVTSGDLTVKVRKQNLCSCNYRRTACSRCSRQKRNKEGHRQDV